jgi:hypothetical protein
MPKNPNQRRGPDGLYVAANPEEPETLPEPVTKALHETKELLHGATPNAALLRVYKKNFIVADAMVNTLLMTFENDAVSNSSRARRRVRDLAVWMDRSTRLAAAIQELEKSRRN